MATALMLIRSPAMLMRRGPARSITGPKSAWDTTYGAISANAMIPVCTALPVVVSTNQGSAIADTLVPVQATACAASTPANPRQRRGGNSDVIGCPRYSIAMTRLWRAQRLAAATCEVETANSHHAPPMRVPCRLRAVKLGAKLIDFYA